MDEDPTIQDRPERSYRGVHAVTTMGELDERIPALTDESFAGLDAAGLQPAGPPFVRYLVIDMPDRVEVELGIPLDAASVNDGEPTGSLPRGRYAVLIYQGVENGIASNKRLIEWISERGETIDRHASADGEAFAGRAETFLTDPADEPDRSRWQTEVAIKLEG